MKNSNWEARGEHNVWLTNLWSEVRGKSVRVIKCEGKKGEKGRNEGGRTREINEGGEKIEEGRSGSNNDKKTS